MTTDKFLLMLVAYYGIDAAKDETRITMIREYISQLSDQQRKRAFDHCVKTFIPTAANHFPIIAHYEAALHTESDSDKGAIEAWSALCKKSHRYFSIAVEDHRIVHALDMIGGWITFCDRTTESEVFMRKDFVKAFKSADGNGEPKLYQGELDDSDSHILYLGDPDRIKTKLIPEGNKDTLKLIEKASKNMSLMN